jgi:MFS family permease
MAERLNQEDARAGKGSAAFLPALEYPGFRLLWASGLFTWVGRWIEITVGAWLVLELTDSPFQVGMLGTFRFASMLLGPFCGAICDRVNQRLILLAVQVVYCTATLAVLALFAVSRIEVWHLFAFTFIGGLCYTFDFSARYSVASSIVRHHHITSSISLIQAASGITSILGPLAGGRLLKDIGAAGCFALIAATFLLSFWSLLPLKVAKSGGSNGPSIWKELVSGLLYIKEDRFLMSLVLIAAMVNLFLFPYSFTLLPIYARNILGTGADGFGLLMAGAGTGAVLGSIATGALFGSAGQGRILVGSVAAWSLILIVLSLSSSFALSMALLVLAGAMQGISMSLVHAQLMIRSRPEMRGRVSGARALAITTLSAGTLVTGFVTNFWGVSTAFMVNSLVFLLITILIVLWAPDLVKRNRGF